MSDTLDSQINKKVQRVKELFKLMDLHFSSKKFDREINREIEDEKFRLEFKLKTLENQGLDNKIESYEKVLKLLQNNGVVISKK